MSDGVEPIELPPISGGPISNSSGGDTPVESTEPTTHVDLDPDQHRFIFKALLLENQELAKVGEFVVDIANGLIYIKGADGLLHSKAAELADRMQELETSGLIDSALAFENNARLWTVYISGNHCRIDYALKLSRSVRYYAIRGINAQGQMQYITGNIVDGSIENALVDVFPFTTDPNIAFPGEAQQGVLHTPNEILDGHAYFIDLCDINRYVISTVPCQILRVPQLDFALSPDKNILALDLSSSQDMIDPDTGNDITFLYQGQSLNSIDFYVHARYSNGDRRYINHEISTSRLVVTIPTDNDIDRNTIGSTFQISARYYTEELNTGDGGGYNDLNYASIDGFRTIKVIEDIFIGIDYIFPVPVVRTMEDGVRVIKLHAFAKYQNNQFVDVSENTRLVSTNFDEESFGIIQNFSMSLGIGHAGQTFDQEGLRINMNPALYGRWMLLEVPGAPWPVHTTTPIARFDPITYPDTIRMRLQPSESQLYSNTGAFSDLGKVTVGGVVYTPTHFRVRSIIEPGFVHTIVPIPVTQFNEFTIGDTTTIRNKLAGFHTNNDGINYPVFVEFFRYNQDTEQYDWLAACPFFTQQYVFLQIAP
jgi:hypothetical protein